jgi:hypothetical protein
MPTSASDFAALQKLTPAEAVAWLIARSKLTKSYAWQDVWQAEHSTQFTVSRWRWVMTWWRASRRQARMCS